MECPIESGGKNSIRVRDYLVFLVSIFTFDDCKIVSLCHLQKASRHFFLFFFLLLFFILLLFWLTVSNK